MTIHDQYRPEDSTGLGDSGLDPAWALFARDIPGHRDSDILPAAAWQRVPGSGWVVTLKLGEKLLVDGCEQ